MINEWENHSVCLGTISNEWRFLGSYGKVITGYEKLQSTVSKWHSLRPIMCSAPGSNVFRSAILFDEFRERLQRSAKRYHIIIMVYCLILSLASFTLWMTTNYFKFRIIFISTLLLTIFFYLDYRIVICNTAALQDRSKYLSWIYLRGGKYMLLCLLFMIAIGLTQVLLVKLLGGMEPLVYKYGAVYKYIWSGELWRILPGPYLHSGLRHWLINTTTLILIAPILMIYSLRNSIIVFLVGNLLSTFIASTTYLYFGTHGDVFGGVSGGIFAIIGFIIGTSLKDKDAFPKYFWFYFLNFGVLSLILTWLMNPRTSNIAHIVGMLTGLIITYIPKLRLT